MKKKTFIAAAVAAAIVSALGLSVSAANSATQPNGSDEAFYLQDLGTGVALTAGSSVAFGANIAGGPDEDNSSFTEKFVTPAGTLNTYAFLAPRGSERTKSAWNILTEAGDLMPSMSPNDMITNSLNTPGSVAAVKATGGNYSLGIAFVNQAGTVLSASYTYITMTPGTGAFTFETPAGPVVVAPTTQTFTQPLQVTSMAAADGALSLVAPTVTPTIIGNPVLTNGTFGLSVSTGTLGGFYVQDDRFATHKGWTLTTNVADFAGPISVSKAQLGVKPVLVAAGSTSAGVTAGAEQVAGSAVYPSTFATAANNTAVGRTNFNADLRFVAPASAPAGTYTSTLTLTVITAP